jgi:hypothetical protein
MNIKIKPVDFADLAAKFPGKSLFIRKFSRRICEEITQMDKLQVGAELTHDGLKTAAHGNPFMVGLLMVMLSTEHGRTIRDAMKDLDYDEEHRAIASEIIIRMGKAMADIS